MSSNPMTNSQQPIDRFVVQLCTVHAESIESAHIIHQSLHSAALIFFIA